MKKIRKDKTNAAVYEAMKKTLNHPQTQKILDMSDVGWLETHRDGFDMEYMSLEHRLNQFFITTWATMVTQLEEKFGTEQAIEIRERLKKVFSCKGLVYNSKNAYPCHHPLCPLCHHRKHYRTIKDLKSYLKEGNSLHVLALTEPAPMEKINMTFGDLEARAKRFTKAINKHVEQWIRIPHLSYDEEAGIFNVSCVLLIVVKSSKVQPIMVPIYTTYEQEVELQPRANPKASLDSMPEVLCDHLYYDPLVLKYGGSRAMELWDRKTPGFRYRAKVAHR
ncbi:hypothetical protein P4B35_22015 [Pontiellaceae bacterium B12227]|nr:hypothetical protein [Pontiellaceae bacterium B12227]